MSIASILVPVRPFFFRLRRCSTTAPQRQCRPIAVCACSGLSCAQRIEQVNTAASVVSFVQVGRQRVTSVLLIHRLWTGGWGTVALQGYRPGRRRPSYSAVSVFCRSTLVATQPVVLTIQSLTACTSRSDKCMHHRKIPPPASRACHTLGKKAATLGDFQCLARLRLSQVTEGPPAKRRPSCANRFHWPHTQTSIKLSPEPSSGCSPADDTLRFPR